MSVRPLRLLLVAAGLLVLTNGLVLFVAVRVLQQPLGWESAFTRQVFVVVAVAAVGAVVLDPLRADGRLAPQSRIAAAAVVGFATWALLSSLWSLTPDITRGRAAIYVGLAAFSWVIADLTVAAIRDVVLWVSSICVATGLLAVVLSDSIALDVNDDWRGIFTNRNSFAPIAGIAILMAASVAYESVGRRRVGAVVVALLSGVAMLGSGSRTAWLALFAAGGAALLVTASRYVRSRWGTLGIRLLLTAGALGSAVVVTAVAALWNESTFEKRRQTWSLVWDRIVERPLHGYGWFNVWGDADFIAAHERLQQGSAHGSFLEVWLGLGLVGLVPFLVIVSLALFGASREAWREPSAASWAWLALVVFLVIENLTESFVLWFSYNWVLLMVAALKSGVGGRWPPGGQTPADRPMVSLSAR